MTETRPTVVQRAAHLIREYVRFQYTSGHLALIGHVRTLPHDARALTRVGLLLVGAAILATPLLAAYASRLSGVGFADVRGGERVISVPAILLALALFSAAWGYLLTALAQGPAVVWIVGGLRYAFGMLAVGLAAGRSFWHVIPVALPVVIGAMSMGDRPARASWRGPSVWGNIALAVLLAGVWIRLSPLPEGIRALWYLYCVPVAVPFLLLHLAVARWGRGPAHGRALVAAVVTLAYFGVTWNKVGVRDLTHWFHIMLDNLTYWLQIVWFVLGAAFVAGAIEFGRFARKVVGVVAPAPVPLWTLLVVWGIAVGWIGLPAASDAKIGTIIMLAVACVILAWRWRRQGMTREWLAGWLVASLAALLIVGALSGYDFSGYITREAGTLSIIGFVYALLWDITGRIPDVPLETAWFGRPGPLVLYLGVILLASAATLFGIAASLEFFQTVVVVHQYLGAITLWTPMVLLVFAKAWPRIPARAVERFTSAFMIGILAALPIFLARAARVDVADYWIDVTAVLVLAWLVRRWPEAADPLVAGGIGAAVMFGMAVHLTTGIPTVFLNGLFVTLGALFGIPLFQTIAEAVLAVSRPPSPSATALFTYFWVAPIAAAVIAAAASRVLRPRAPSADQAVAAS